jgi:Mg-chelatase subunit ChlI
LPSAIKPAKFTADAPAKPTGAAETEKCLEAIWEQLIAAPPSRGRSMSTVVLQDAKVLLSSWEVAAFVVEGGQEAEDLRRAVVARALLAVAGDQRKRSGDESALASALVHARSEVSYFQGRVEQAKRAKNTEAAVNLGISTKRLLSFIEESEKLQP